MSARRRVDPIAYNKAQAASAEYIMLEVENWESKFRYVINCIMVTMHALDFVEVFGVDAQRTLSHSVYNALVLIKEDNVFKRQISKDINDETAAANRARSLTFHAIALAAHNELSQNAIPAIMQHEPSKRNVFNQNVTSFLKEADVTLVQIMTDIEDCQKKHSHEDFFSVAV